MLRKIISQCDTGEVKIADKNGEDVRIVDLAKYSYHFVKPPISEGPASSVKPRKEPEDEEESPDHMEGIQEEDSESEGSHFGAFAKHNQG